MRTYPYISSGEVRRRTRKESERREGGKVTRGGGERRRGGERRTKRLPCPIVMFGQGISANQALDFI
jgi:hypothetical protein